MRGLLTQFQALVAGVAPMGKAVGERGAKKRLSVDGLGANHLLEAEAALGLAFSAEQTQSPPPPQQDEEFLYGLERALQLAYAVGDRNRIQRLESDIETFTGWGFKRERLWLSQQAGQSSLAVSPFIF